MTDNGLRGEWRKTNYRNKEEIMGYRNQSKYGVKYCELYWAGVDRRIAKAKQLAKQHELEKQLALADEWLIYLKDVHSGGSSVPPPKKPKPDFLKPDWWGRGNNP
jgi:hypothetical protein